jgi:cytochrome P450
VLNHSEVYHKPAAAKALLASILGRGVLIAEDAQHRAQRKALNPAFGPGQLRDLTGVFLDKANEVRAPSRRAPVSACADGCGSCVMCCSRACRLATA